MAWNYDRSKERISSDIKNLPDIEVKKLERDADLENLLSVSTCRDIFGTHVYLEVANFSRLAESAEDKGDLRPLVRAIHIYQRQIAWITESVFGAVRIHFQGARVHALIYRPIDKSEKLAAKALLLMILVRDFMRYVFNERFPTYENLVVCAGADLGNVIGTQNGMRGGRELLFVGDAANHAAKIIDTGLRLTKRLYDSLPEALQEICELADKDNNIYRVAVVGKDDAVVLASDEGITWDRDELGKRVDADIKQFPLKDVEFHAAKELIDFDLLSLKNNKRVLAASAFADLSGFTRFVAGCDDADTEIHALKAFHLIRQEFTRVVTQDFTGALRVQFQGDRMQVLVHLPEDDATKIARKSVDIAAALQSSLDLIKDLYDGIGKLHLAVGIDMGTVVVTRLGERGYRDRIVLGSSVLDAAANEERTSKREIGISKAIYDELEEDVQAHFSYSAKAKCYVAIGLTVETLQEKLAKAAAATYHGSAPVVITSGPSGITVTREEVQGGRKVTPARSFAD